MCVIYHISVPLKNPENTPYKYSQHGRRISPYGPEVNAVIQCPLNTG